MEQDLIDTRRASRRDPSPDGSIRDARARACDDEREREGDGGSDRRATAPHAVLG